MLKMIKEDLHYNLGTLLLGLLVMVFNYPINLALQLSELKDRMDSYMVTTEMSWDGPSSFVVAEKITDLGERMTRTTNMVLCGTGGLLALIIPVAAVLCARCMFHYLMQKSTVDFYMSEPISRQKRFAANYISGLLIMLISLLTGLVLCLPVALAYGVEGMELGTALASSLGFMLVFLMLYTTVIIAILLCGRTFAAVAAVIVINGIGFCVYAVMMVFMNFFDTYIEYGTPIWEKLYYTSPIYYIFEYMERLTPRSSSIAVMSPEVLRLMLVMAGISALLILLAVLLHRIRPSEACGSTLAFPLTRRPLRVILSIMGGLLLSFLGIYQSGVFWVFFFTLLGVVIVHAMAEIVINMDVRMLFCHRIETAICMAAAFGFVCIFVFDPFGYDAYVPEASSLQSVAISYNGDFEERRAISLSDYQYEYETKHPEDIYTTEYWDGQPDGFLEMAITEEPYVDAVLELACCGAEHASGVNYRGYEDYYDEDSYLIDVAYRLRSGSVRYRRYELSRAEVDEYMPGIFASMEYKTAMYPILELPEEELGLFGIEYADDTEGARLEAEGKLSGKEIRTNPYASRDWDDFGSVYDINEDQSFRRELLAALKQDISDMRFEDYEDWFYTVDSGYNEETGRVETFSDSELYKEGDVPGCYLIDDIIYYIPETSVLMADMHYEAGDNYTYEYRDIYPVFDSFTHVREVLSDYGYVDQD